MNDDDKTRIIGRGNSAGSGDTTRPSSRPISNSAAETDDGDATRIIGSRPNARCSADPEATRILNPEQKSTEAAAEPSYATSSTPSSDKTILHRRSKKPSGKSASAASDDSYASENVTGDVLSDPVTGWLVIIDGPGKGNAVKIGEQDNSVGRGNSRIKIDFGDQGISRGCAFIVRYDPKKRRFKLLPGEGANIVYLNDDDLDSPTVIKNGDIIELCSTKIRFIPLCDETFDWSDTE